MSNPIGNMSYVFYCIWKCCGPSQAWSTPSLDTPMHSSAAWSTGTAASPTSSPDILFGDTPYSTGGPFTSAAIGKSARAPQDWLAGHQHMDTSDGSPMPFLPFASSGLSSPYGVLDRYDLFPGAPVFDYASVAGADSLSVSAFSDPDGMGMGLGLGRGFTHHSRTAGDLIFGARTHQHAGIDDGPGFGFGVGLDMGMTVVVRRMGVAGSRASVFLSARRRPASLEQG
ncbi:hypothetical protein K488DRAFT_82992 [Vararia minispora EC-137]|uniref:Uncharacterized protein n=1 Tax=Vararia minispora EC-137 TaxID=1314806 RepID=A0ACB8QUQ0_9AGAM|nr:hypothetical protein K488DRAFT_82992 [Vararia minispora EC-137]